MNNILHCYSAIILRLFFKKKNTAKKIMDIETVKLNLEMELTEELHSEEQNRQYHWVDKAEGLTWETFCADYPKHKLWFYTLLDVSADDGTGWQQLATNLGLKGDEINWCSKYCGTSGPTSMVFTKLDQSTTQPVSLHHVLHHLISLGRHDLIHRIPWQECIEELKDKSSKPPLEFQSGVALQQQFKHNASHHHVHTQGLLGSSALASSLISLPKKRPYACSILMLYADDAKDFAIKVCRQLREAPSISTLPSRGRVGVLLLEEQQRLLVQDPHTLLYKWFTQVNYIVPVLSPQLLQHFITWSATPTASSNTHLYHRYLFRLTLDQYVSQACRNTRCRPLCPAAVSRQVCETEVVQTLGVLQVVRVCEDYASEDASHANPSVESFAHLLLKTP